MSLKRKSSILLTVRFRLTLIYTALFAVLSLAVFLLTYLVLASGLQQRIDADLQKSAKEFEAIYRTQGIKALSDDFRHESEAKGIEDVFFRLLSPHRELLASSNLRAWGELAEKTSLAAPPHKGLAFITIALSGHHYKVRVASSNLGEGNTLQIGYSLNDNDKLINHVRETFLLAFALTLICGCGIGWFVGKRAMSGVDRITQIAAHIGQGNIASRVILYNEGKEIDDLCMAFNNMLERIQVLVTELKEVTENMAHDLRSPITRIRGLAEMTLTGEQHLEDYQDMAGMIVEESDHLIAIINTMLEIAKVDSGIEKFLRMPVDMSEIVRTAGELFRPFAEDKGLYLEVDVPSEALIVYGDSTKLQRVIANLLDNAIKYTSTGKVLLSARETQSNVVISVIDSGTGITEKDLPHIFERFYRGDQSRSTPGNGLGLSLAQTYVHAHEGNITVESFQGMGSTFIVSVPCGPSVS